MDKDQITKSYFEKGIKFFLDKNYKLAQKFFKETLKNLPENIPALENLSKSYIADNQFENAEEILKKIIALEKNDKIAFKLLTKIYIETNQLDKLNNIVSLGIKNNKLDKKYRVTNKLFYPNFFKSKEEIELRRKNFIKNVDELIDEKKNYTLDIDNEAIEPAAFKISYDGFDNLKINKKLVSLYKKIYPKLNQNISLTSKKNDKITIGFISEFFTDHTILKLFKGIIYKLNKKKFKVYVFHSNNTREGIKHRKIKEDEIIHDFENVTLSKNFEEKIKLILSKSLDILFYPDIHMSMDLYYLTFLKLAKKQFTSWGHPETTGGVNIDFFLSSKLMEVNDAQNHYSEKLVLSNYLPMYFYKPIVKKKLENEMICVRNKYSCPQTLIKFHPEFDLIIKKILEKDKKAEIFFIKDSKEILSKQIFNRLKKIMPENIDRVKFINRLLTEEWINHCGASSVLLDPLYFGSGNSFHESMYYGTPTVSMPTKYLKSRIVLGAYKQMEIIDPPITNSIDEYVNKSIEIANEDKKKALELKLYLKNQAEEKLFENFKFISELENIFESINISKELN